MKKLFLALLTGATLLWAGGIEWEKDYEAAVAEAGRVHKPILFVFSRHDCKWCRHLEETTFENPEVIARLNRDLVNVIAYSDGDDVIPRELWAPATPSLWFLDSSGEAMFSPIQGYVGPEDLLGAVDIVLKEFEKKALKARYGKQAR